MAEKRANFVSVSALDKRPASKRELLRGLVRQAPFVAKNFQLYFRNGWPRRFLRTKVVAPYAVTFYVTHKCNLACSYCTQKEPDVFSDELPTGETIALLKRIRKETDSIVITGGEPTLRPDIEELAEAARFECIYRSLLLITNGTLLDRKPRIVRAVTGLVVSLDALAADPTNPLSKPAALPKVLENLELAKELLGNPRRITISTVIEQWNIGEVEKLLDWCGEQGFVLAKQRLDRSRRAVDRLSAFAPPLDDFVYQRLVLRILQQRQVRHFLHLRGLRRKNESLLPAPVQQLFYFTDIPLLDHRADGDPPRVAQQFLR